MTRLLTCVKDCFPATASLGYARDKNWGHSSTEGKTHVLMDNTPTAKKTEKNRSPEGENAVIQ
jgi:hypothetical protein